jgi:hypothetical protein
MEKSCLICGGDPICEAVFFPKDPQAWGAPARKHRAFRYRLCEQCFVRPDKASVVERIIISEISGQQTQTMEDEAWIH